VRVDTRKRIAGTEADLSIAWARSFGRRLRTESGLDVDVLYPGRRPGSAGPDYRDAVLSVGRLDVLRGDVELHVSPADWRRHGHDLDPAYSRVVLHAVARGDGTLSTVLPGGREAPVLVLEPRCRSRDLPCAEAFKGAPGVVVTVLEAAGIERFRARAVRMAGECAAGGLLSVLLRGVARALGYAANADAGMQLGALLVEEGTWALMQSVGATQRCAYALGTAGLLPSQRGSVCGDSGCSEVTTLEREWRGLGGSMPSMPASAWRLSGVYVNNSPVRRVVALADLAPGIEGLFREARTQLADSGTARRAPAAGLERLFTVAGDSYWRRRYDFGKHTRESDLVGAAKAREVVVNALLPVLLATAMREGDESLFRGVVRAFVRYPGPRANSITQHMQRQLGLPLRPRRAAVDQGLLHVYTEYCRHGLCDACPLRDCSRCS